MNTLKTKRAAFALMLCAAIAVTANAYRSESYQAPGFAVAATAAGSQDTVNLERRISLLEQRFYSVESSINRLERQATISQRTIPQQSGTSEMEVNLLRAEVETLRRRIGEIECGLIKLDERTATPAARESRRKANPPTTDPCRQSAELPLKLSARP
jgi:hypothetical protein